MDFWQRARSFAEEAAKKSQSFAEEAAKKSQNLTQGISSANFSDVVSEASKRSKEFAAEASKKSKEFAAEALKRADQITAQIPPAAAVLTNLVDSSQKGYEDADLETYGITDDLRDFIRGITMHTFQDFPIEDDSEVCDIPTVSNVRQDLTEWQERHAKLVLLTVKEISKLRYQLCPRSMKERKFWRIYFILVNTHVAPYEKRYMELKSAEKIKDGEAKEISSVGTSSETAVEISKQKNNNSKKSSASEQDLDVFLLGDGDLEESDDGRPDDGDDGFDDEFDKI